MNWFTGLVNIFSKGMDVFSRWFAKKEREEERTVGKQLQNGEARKEVLKTHVEVNKREENIARATDSELDDRLSKFQ